MTPLSPALSCVDVWQRVEACARLHLSLEALARVFPHILFVRIRCSDALPAYPDAGLPALMLYRGGKCTANALRVSDALPTHFTDADVARMLQSKDVLRLPQGDEWMERAEQQRIRKKDRSARPFALGKQEVDSECEDDN